MQKDPPQGRPEPEPPPRNITIKPCEQPERNYFRGHPPSKHGLLKTVYDLSLYQIDAKLTHYTDQSRIVYAKHAELVVNLMQTGYAMLFPLWSDKPTESKLAERALSATVAMHYRDGGVRIGYDDYLNPIAEKISEREIRERIEEGADTLVRLLSSTVDLIDLEAKLDDSFKESLKLSQAWKSYLYPGEKPEATPSNDEGKEGILIESQINPLAVDPTGLDLGPNLDTVYYDDMAWSHLFPEVTKEEELTEKLAQVVRDYSLEKTKEKFSWEAAWQFYYQEAKFRPFLTKHEKKRRDESESLKKKIASLQSEVDKVVEVLNYEDPITKKIKENIKILSTIGEHYYSPEELYPKLRWYELKDPRVAETFRMYGKLLSSLKEEQKKLLRSVGNRKVP